MSNNVLAVVDFYRTVVESLGFTVRGNKVVLIHRDGEEDMMVANKQLVLPDDTFLRSPNWETEIPFHPLCENPQRGESDVVKMVLESAVANLNVSLLGVLVHLYTDVVSIDDTKKLTTEQAELLPFVSSSGKNLRKAILGLVGKIDMSDDQHSLLTCVLRRRCPLGDVKYERVCVVRFPFADMDRKDTPYGLKTVAEFDTLRGLLDFVLPGWENDDAWSVGTNSFVAPYFTSVMMMYGKLGKRLNEVIDQYRDVSPALANYYAPGIEKVMEMIERPGHLENLRDAIPALGDSNKGHVEIKRQPETGYKLEQPKQPVDVPWNTPEQPATPAVNQQPVAPRVDDAETASYVPGQVVPTVNPMLQMQQLYAQQMGVMPQMNLGAAQVDMNSFHGRQMARQVLLQPLGMQQAAMAPVGGSPFIDNGRSAPQTAPYVPGQLNGATGVQQNVGLTRQPLTGITGNGY